MTELLIRPAEAQEVADLPDMQVQAGALFRDLGMSLVADGPAPAVEGFERACRTRDLLIAIVDDAVVGFVRTRSLDGALHVEQLTVAPKHQGRGIGRALMMAAEEIASDRGFTCMTLTTFRDVPFNGPFYVSLGWRVLDPSSLAPGLLAERQEERDAGIDRWPRVAMGKMLC